MKRRILLSIVLIFMVISAYTQEKPIIGVSSVAGESSTSAPLTYIRSIKRAGGVPLVIPITSDKEGLARILEVSEPSSKITTVIDQWEHFRISSTKMTSIYSTSS